MAGTRDRFALTEKQELFVEAFVGECEFDAISAYKAAGYNNNMKLYSAAMRVLASEPVKREIHKRLHESTFWLNESAVIDRLWKEGTTANAASARINALVWVGKHLGMWKEKEEKEVENTYNIINYSAPRETMIKDIENSPKVVEQKDKVSLPEGVSVLSYKEPK